MSTVAPVAWRWKDGKNAITASWQRGGWPCYADEPDGRKESCRSVLARRAQGLGPCDAPAEWKVERRERGRPYAVIGWYCTHDLPAGDCPPDTAEEFE